ncbi:probable oligoribonuclease [Drosophila pseudoobscura]|uniref:Probable oligoribonuclease n=1 Tax=Drosophila pseudoobscura pseudoobscura TaxID=46245 RepID=A0A6I8UPA8_DROPS|nr:probable oligoribonuclease [Drosophila pseudoobscura]
MLLKLKRLGLFGLGRLLQIQSRLATNQNRKMSTSKSGADDETDLVWMDLEMTGLDVDTDKILEVSCIITDKDLNIKSEGPCFAINYPEDVYKNMNEWCIKHHNESGLIDRCRSSDVTPDKAGDLVMSYLQKNIPKGKCPLAGSSVYMDRLFIRKYMSPVNEYLHYRIVDVSTIKELAKRWCPDIAKAAPRKVFAHRSLDDIMESIQELKYYKEHLFK